MITEKTTTTMQYTVTSYKKTVHFKMNLRLAWIEDIT